VTAEIVETVAVGLAAGVLSGMFGVGGGLLFVPALVLIADLSQLDATATSLAAMIPVVLVGLWRQHVAGNVRWREAIVVGLASAGGVAGGTVLADSLPEHALRRLFAMLLLLIAVRLVWTAVRSGALRDPAGSEEG
jgi:uncharacterized membrane protein YfcA